MTDESQAAWEGVADELLTETGWDEPPVDAYDLAACCGVRVVDVKGPGAALHRDTIFVDRRARLVRRHGHIAHELGHWALRRGGEDDTEAGARYLAGALMLPRRAFDRDLAESWAMERLRARHLNASVEMIARRIVALREGVATIFDNGTLKRRVVSPWVAGRFPKATSFERHLAAQCLASGTTVEIDSMLYAVPVFDLEAGWRRVVVVAEAEQLSLRF